MTPAEVIVLCFLYVATLVLGQRAAAFLVPDAQEIGFALAAVVGGLTASVLYYHRERKRAPGLIVFATGACMAVLAILVGTVTELIWQPFLFPSISIPVAAVVTLLLPFLLFPLGRRFAGEGADAAYGAGVPHIMVAVTAMILVCVGVWQFPAPGRSTLRLSTQTFPGLSIDLPSWDAVEKKTSIESGTVKLTDPVGGDHFISVRWIDSEPVLPDDFIKPIAASMSMTQKEPTPTRVGDHDGVTFTLYAADGDVSGAATVWNCSQDHRVMWIITTISGPRASMLASHGKIVESVKCHTNTDKGTAGDAGKKVFPAFTAPPGFVRQPINSSLLYIGPKRQTIRFDPGVPGCADIVSTHISPDQAATIFKGTGLLTTVEGAPQMFKVTDLEGQERRVWTATGQASDGGRIQVEIMVWWCDTRDMTFIGAYATEGTHNPRDGVDTLLPAVCH